MEENKESKQETGLSEEPKKKNKVKMILIPIILLLIIVGGGVGYYFYSQGVNYFVTDNAKVTAKMYSVMPAANGKLISWDVEVGDLVEQDQVLGRQEVLPYITAPINGTVVKNDGAVNQMAATGSALAVIADTANMYIGVNVEETDITKVHVGQLVDVKIDAYPKQSFEGHVTEIDQTTQTYFSSGLSSFSTSGTYTKVTQLIPIKVTIDNHENLPLVFGMNANVKIHLK